MAVTDDKQRNFVARAIVAGDTFMESYEELQAVRAEYDALDYGANLLPAAFDGENQHIELADIVALIVTQAAVEALMVAGHRTNILRLKA